MEFLVFLSIVIVANACAIVATSKGRSGVAWFLIGMPFSLLALFVVAAMPARRVSDATHRTCPHCAEMVLKQAVVCKHCTRDLPAVADKPSAPLEYPPINSSVA